MADVLLVRAGGREVALDVGALVEVMEMPRSVTVPSGSPAFRGVVQVRRRHLPVFHLGALLVAGDCPDARGDVLVIARLSGYLVGLEVDEASEVRRVAVTSLPDEPHVAGAVGVIRHDGHFTPVVDVRQLGSQVLESGVMT